MSYPCLQCYNAHIKLTATADEQGQLFVTLALIRLRVYYFSMNITREGKELVIRLSMEQDSFDAIGESAGLVPNLIGVIEGDEQGIHQSIDMTYKDKAPQIVDRLVQTYYDNDEFKKKCEKWGIDVFECQICGFCRKPIWGSFTFKDGKISCFGCESNKIHAHI